MASTAQTSPIDLSGTTIGNFSDAAKAFDGVTNAPGLECAKRGNQKSGFIGRTLATPAAVGGAVIYGSNDLGFATGATQPSYTLRLFGKTGPAPVNGADGTELAALTFDDTSDESAGRALNSVDTTTVWDHVWVFCDGGVVVNHRLAEVQMFGPGSPMDDPGFRFGVQTHCAQSMDPVVFGELTAAIPAVSFIRDELFFDQVRKTDGTLLLNPNFVAYLDALALSGHGMLVELLWGDTDVTGDAFQIPTDTAQREEFANYASFVLTEIKARGIPVVGAELWNEIDGSWPGIPGKNFGQLTEIERYTLADWYVDLAVAVRARLTTDHPDVPFVGVADVGLQMPWITRVLDRGIAQHMDALVVHYGSGDDVATLRADLTARGINLPIWITEYVASSGTEEAAAGTAVRRFAEVAAAGGKLFCYYLAKPHGGFDVQALLNADGTVRPRGAAYEVLADLMGGGSYVGPVQVGTGVQAEAFETTESLRVTIVWGSGDVTVSGHDFIQDSMGNVVEPATQHTLSGSPFLVFGTAATIAPVAGTEALFDFRDQFTGTQATPWEYGWRNAITGNWSLMTWSAANARWEGEGSFHFIKSDGIHPQASVQTWATARVQVTEAQRVRISGFFWHPTASGTDGVKIRIALEDGTVLAQGESRNAQRNFDIVADIPAGAWVEFGVNMKEGQASDFTRLQANIALTADELTTLPVDLGGSTPPPPTGDGFTGSVTYTYAGGVLVGVTTS